MTLFSRIFGFTKNNDQRIEFDLNIKKLRTIGFFWEFIVSHDKWYIKYSPYRIKNIDKYISELEPLIIQSTNALRVHMDFSYDEYWKVMDWDNFLIRADMNEENKFKRNKSVPFKQFCFNCKHEIGFQQRYPKSICHKCSEKITDAKGKAVEFFNTGASGSGCQGYYHGTSQKEKYNSERCSLDGKEYFAEEGRFGGIVIQSKE